MDTDSKILPLMPLRDVVIFPHTTLPLYVGREKSLNAIHAAQSGANELLLVAQKNAQASDPQPEDLFSVATRAQIKQYSRLSDGNVKLLVEAIERVVVQKFITTEPYFQVRFESLPLERFAPQMEQKWSQTLIQHFEAYCKLVARPFSELAAILHALSDPHQLVDLVAAQVSLKVKDRQNLLELSDPIARMELLSTLILSEIEILKLDRKIKDQVREKIEKSQKEYFLNEQMSAIQKELGGDGDIKDEIQALEKRLAEKNMPQAARDRALKELKRLKLSGQHMAEAVVIRNYLDLILDLPWNEFSEDSVDLGRSEKILNEDHFGLKDIKERIVEFLAVKTKAPAHKAPILCFLGPPGVGKTSLAASIARALDRKFERISLGGLRDESELKGHRRTYVAALPGKILNALKKAGTGNPVILLDEVDKMGLDFRGDPASVLLEILDPEQNKTFTDHYLDLEYDLSKVLFIATANILDPISPPLRDRLEIISIAGYTEHEKIAIAQNFILPREATNHGLSLDSMKWGDQGLSFIIQNYTREAGVRGVQKEIAKICRKLVKKSIQSPSATFDFLDEANIQSYLGAPKFKPSSLSKLPEIGVATGLAWTAQGGEILAVEANVLPGKGKLQITGQLGSVMQESAKAALSYTRSLSKYWGLRDDYFSLKDIHIHVPEGATPKDGPSAGITIAVALLSAILKTPLSKEVGMTGEITLRGRVLPIGGLKEKLLAAKRNKLRTVFYPAENEKDVTELDPALTEGLELIPVSKTDEIIERLFESRIKEKVRVSDFYIDQQPIRSTLGPSSPLL